MVIVVGILERSVLILIVIGDCSGDGYDLFCVVYCDDFFDFEYFFYYYLCVVENLSFWWSIYDC